MQARSSARLRRGASPGSRGASVCVCACGGSSPLPAPRHNPQKVAARRKSRILPEPRPPGWRAAVAKGHQQEGGAPGALVPLPRRLAPRSGAPGASLPACSSPAGVERRGWEQPYERRGLGGGSPPPSAPCDAAERGGERRRGKLREGGESPAAAEPLSPPPLHPPPQVAERGPRRVPGREGRRGPTRVPVPAAHRPSGGRLPPHRDWGDRSVTGEKTAAGGRGLPSGAEPAAAAPARPR